MGCCVSSPHTKRRYCIDPADLDEEFVSEEDLPLRTFGKYRGNGVIVPDDINGLPSTRDPLFLASDPDTLLYQAEIDNAKACRCFRPGWALVPFWPIMMIHNIAVGKCSCDEMCCWVRKEYSTRNYYRVYPNRIEINDPQIRFPFGLLGCGSWSADNVKAHPFDRGAFGFRRVHCGAFYHFLGFAPVFGDVVARQRCQCNGPVWHGGWWCDEWPCDMLCCSYRYNGLADGDEVAFASNLALQAYFEGRQLTAEDMEKCLQYWRENVSEYHDPTERKRKVMCHPWSIPCIPTTYCYKNICQCRQKIPIKDRKVSRELSRVYKNYEKLRQRQIERYTNFKHPVRLSSVCRVMGCRRVCGRKGLCFCTEGCRDNKAAGCCYKHLERQPGDPFPPPPRPDLDDHNQASHVLRTVLGNPPENVVYKEWGKDAAGQYTVITHQATAKEPDPEESTFPSVVSTIRQDDRLSTNQQNHRVPVLTPFVIYKGYF